MAHMELSQAIPIGSLVRTLCSPYNLRISLGCLWPRRFEKSHNHQEMFRYAVQGFETFHLSLRPSCMLARESHEKDILEVDILRRRVFWPKPVSNPFPSSIGYHSSYHTLIVEGFVSNATDPADFFLAEYMHQIPSGQEWELRGCKVCRMQEFAE